MSSGLWPVMLTPLKDDSTLDIKGLERLTDFYLQAGADGLFANCLSSEMFQLTTEERLQSIRTVMSAVKGKVEVIATGTFSQNTEKNVEFIKKVHDTGVAAVIISSNQLTEPSAGEDAFKKKLEEIMEASGEIPLGVYECPVPHKRLLSPALMRWMADSGRFFYHKDTSCKMQDITAKLAAVENSSFGFYNANIPTALESLHKGARGLSPIGANFVPELYSFLLNNYQDEGKQALLQKVNALLSVLDPLIHMHYPLSAKIFLQKRGLAIGLQSRVPVMSLPAQDITKLDDLMHVFRQLTEEIGQPVAEPSQF